MASVVCAASLKGYYVYVYMLMASSDRDSLCLYLNAMQWLWESANCEAWMDVFP